jgi:hypothetical protein
MTAVKSFMKLATGVQDCQDYEDLQAGQTLRRLAGLNAIKLFFLLLEKDLFFQKKSDLLLKIILEQI